MQALTISGTEAGVTAAAKAARLPEQLVAGELANLDFLRAMAVGIVFFNHLLLTMNIREVGDLGHFGVLLFFVHTALVLMMSMERLGLSGRNLYVAFVVRRVFRIYPLSILCVVVVASLRIPPTSWNGYEWTGWPTVLSNIFLTQNLTQSTSVNCVLWSLPFEIQMYAILPLLFAWALRFPAPRAMYAAWLTAVAIATSECIARAGSCGTDFLLARYLPCFLAGAVAWRLMTTRNPRFSGSAWVLFLVALVPAYCLPDALGGHRSSVIGALHGMVRNDHRIWWSAYLHLVNDWFFCATVGLAVPLFREIRNFRLKSINKHVARYSYGIYISHVPILWLCFTRLRVGSEVVSGLLAILLTAVISVLVYHCLEDPAIRVGKRLAARVVERLGPKVSVVVMPTDSSRQGLELIRNGQVD
jgi:peptidoglycan/LPS O-acetylase OafA/YrhL